MMHWMKKYISENGTTKSAEIILFDELFICADGFFEVR